MQVDGGAAVRLLLCCAVLRAMAPPRVSSLGDGNVHGSASTKGRGVSDSLGEILF